MAVLEKVKRGWNVEVMAKYDNEFIQRIKHLYETTDISLNQLAKSEGVGKATVIKWSKDYNWVKKNITDRPPTDQKENRPTKPTDRVKLKKEAYKRMMNGETQEKIGQEINVPRSTIANWSATYKWQVDKEVELNKKLFEIRESVIGDRGQQIQELIEWQQKQLGEIKRHIEAEFEKDEPDTMTINFKLTTMEKYLKMQFKLLGIRYTGELTELVRVANQIDTDERRLSIEELKAQKEEEADNNIEIRITGEVNNEKDN